MAMLQHTVGVFTNPDRAWQRIRDERHSYLKVYLVHTPLLALIPVIAAWFGVTQVGWSIGNGAVVRLTPESALWLCVGAYFAQLAVIYALGEYIQWMSRSFGVSGDKTQRRYGSMAMAVYSAAPLMVAGIVLVYPHLWLVATAFMIAGAYSVYLVYEGIPILMNIPKERGFIYSSSVVTVALVLAVVVLAGTVIIWGMGLGPVYTH
jgi:hypothetical protein